MIQIGTPLSTVCTLSVVYSLLITFLQHPIQNARTSWGKQISFHLTYPLSGLWISFRVRYVFWSYARIYTCMCQKISDYLQRQFMVTHLQKNRLPKHNARKWIKHIAFLKQEGPKIFLFLTRTFYFLSANFVDWSSSTNITKYHLLIYQRCYSLLILQ